MYKNDIINDPVIKLLSFKIILFCKRFANEFHTSSNWNTLSTHADQHVYLSKKQIMCLSGYIFRYTKEVPGNI